MERQEQLQEIAEFLLVYGVTSRVTHVNGTLRTQYRLRENAHCLLAFDGGRSGFRLWSLPALSAKVRTLLCCGSGAQWRCLATDVSVMGV